MYRYRDRLLARGTARQEGMTASGTIQRLGHAPTSTMRMGGMGSDRRFLQCEAKIDGGRSGSTCLYEKEPEEIGLDTTLEEPLTLIAKGVFWYNIKINHVFMPDQDPNDFTSKAQQQIAGLKQEAKEKDIQEKAKRMGYPYVNLLHFFVKSRPEGLCS